MALRIKAGLGIPPAGLVERFFPAMRAVARTWKDVSQVVPVEITSWWRDPTRNASAGGASYSQHLVGAAMDGRSPGLTRAQLLPIVQRAAARYGATVPAEASEGSGTSVHVQGLAFGVVRAVLTREPRLIPTARSFVGPARPLVPPPPPYRPAAEPRARQPGGGFNY